jgi:hypothetical protein
MDGGYEPMVGYAELRDLFGVDGEATTPPTAMNVVGQRTGAGCPGRPAAAVGTCRRPPRVTSPALAVALAVAGYVASVVLAATVGGWWQLAPLAVAPIIFWLHRT